MDDPDRVVRLSALVSLKQRTRYNSSLPFFPSPALSLSLSPPVHFILGAQQNVSYTGAVIDDPSFDPAGFAPFVEPTITLLFRAEAESTNTDTYVQLLYVLTVLMRQLGPQIAPYTGKILECLSTLWNLPNANQMTKAAVLNALQVKSVPLGGWVYAGWMDGWMDGWLVL